VTNESWDEVVILLSVLTFLSAFPLSWKMMSLDPQLGILQILRAKEARVESALSITLLTMTITAFIVNVIVS
jgi:hypothetical protein